MELLTYAHLDTSRVTRQFAKMRAHIEGDDWRSAEIKKLAGSEYYRVRLDDTNRLLLKFMSYQGRTVCLALEVIHQHAYEKSRFLRGGAVDESKLEAAAAPRCDQVPQARYLHPGRAEFHLQDKVLSFDDTQDSIYRAVPPLILVGSAGSGKTALLLEKLRHAQGRVLFVTQSAYLARAARDLYHAHGYSNEAQEAEFLSFAEFLETLEIPQGREGTFADFAAWHARQAPAVRKLADAHQVYEEFRGVLSSAPEGPLSCAAYCELGVKQSIFAAEHRPLVHELFERYRAWLPTAKLYDSNLVAHAWQERAVGTYDFVAIDEVQDLTPVQLKLVLRTLHHNGQFLLCGDSNQIVHPNFFAWSRVKSLFWSDPGLAERQVLMLLAANFRNGQEVTRVANGLLKVKHARFGSIDKESNYLVRATAAEVGSVELRADSGQERAELDRVTRRSTRYAVVVLRDSDKAAAKQIFRTPLVFSVQEAKGLEYPTVVLWTPVSCNRAEFAEICDGVSSADLERTELDYKRAKDKSDKALEIYKFYTNALYVAVTRAVQRVIWVETDTGHPLFHLLGLEVALAAADAAPERESTRTEWEREAARLEEQGKREQAAAIRSDILNVRKTPWQPWTHVWAREAHGKIVDGQVLGGKIVQQLYNFALWHEHTHLMADLAPVFPMAAHCIQGYDGTFAFTRRDELFEKIVAPYKRPNFKSILSDCEQYGVDMITQVDASPLMLATAAGNVALVDALLEKGASLEVVDSHGHDAAAYALMRARNESSYARGPFGDIWDRVHPRQLDVQVDGRLVRLFPHQAEYFFLLVMLSAYKTLASALISDDEMDKRSIGFNVDYFKHNVQYMPSRVIPEQRQQRAYVSSVLARAEVNSKYQPARRLWRREQMGLYLPNPTMHLRRRNPGGETVWVPIGEALPQYTTSWAFFCKLLRQRSAHASTNGNWSRIARGS